MSGSVTARRILFIDHTAALGGGEVALLNLVSHLNRVRYEPVVILLSDGPLRLKLEAIAVETHLLSVDKRILHARKDSLGGGTRLRVRDLLKTAVITWRLRRLILNLRADLVHTNSLKADIIGGFAARVAGLPLIWHVRDRIEDDYLPASVVRAFRWLSGLLPTAVIANSAATLSTLDLNDPEQGEAIYGGIALDLRMRVVHDGLSQAGEIPEARPLKQDVRRVGLVGRISPWKGQHIFLSAAVWIHRRFPDVRFEIIGAALFQEEAYERQLRQMVVDLALQDCVEFTGFREDVPAVMAQLDILVHASVTGEPFGQVIIEGMAAGKPVVATAGGGVPEIVVDGVTGLLVPMGDPGAMAGAVCKLLDDPDTAARMGRLGRQRVLQSFTMGQTAAKVEHLYDEVLAQRKQQTIYARFFSWLKSKRSAIERPGGLPSLAGLSTVGGAVAAATAVAWYLRTRWGEHAPTSLPFVVAVAVSASYLGAGMGILATCVSALLVAYFFLPPDYSFAVDPVDQPALVVLIVVGLLISGLIDMLRRANRRAERNRATAESAKAALSFLGKAGAALALPTHADTVLATIAYLANSYLCDWCIMDLVEPSGAIRRALAAHADPPKDEVARRLTTASVETIAPISRSVEAPANDEDPTRQVILSGIPYRAKALDPKALSGMKANEHHADLLRALGDKVYVVVPLTAGNWTAGALTLLRSSPESRPFNNEELKLAVEFAARAALRLSSILPRDMDSGTYTGRTSGVANRA